VRDSRGKVNKIIGPNQFPLPFDLHFGFSFQDKESLLQVRMDMGVGLPSEFDLPEDNFHAIGAVGSRTQEAIVCRFRMARRGICGNVLQMADILLHFELLIKL